ncbi:hypothetical protein L1987_74061 [Smallanthus sonchifolius]|uniref:Uncharacterized protein n=1 Tax=Smallanthus sonchifolius TaxID=185202 RepID=A0ACB9A1S7_9ASTR|nr:hypothetical protein L1987_74061 [Smallanthus sonchifolius]
MISEARGKWLNYALVGNVLNLDLLRNINDFLSLSGLENSTVSYVGGMKVLLTFLGPTDANNFLHNKRDTWHVFNKIAERFGRVVKGSDASFSDWNLVSGRVVVLVYDAFKIVKEVDLHSGSHQFRIWVIEDDISGDHLAPDGFGSDEPQGLEKNSKGLEEEAHDASLHVNATAGTPKAADGVGPKTRDRRKWRRHAHVSGVNSNGSHVVSPILPRSTPFFFSAQGPHVNGKGTNNCEPSKVVKPKRINLGSSERPFIPDLNFDSDDPFGIWELIWKDNEIARNNKKRKVAPGCSDLDGEAVRKRRRVGDLDLNSPASVDYADISPLAEDSSPDQLADKEALATVQVAGSIGIQLDEFLEDVNGLVRGEGAVSGLL